MTTEEVTRDYRQEGRTYLNIEAVKAELENNGYEFEEDGEKYRQVYLESFDSLTTSVASEDEDIEGQQWDLDEFEIGMNEALEAINAFIQMEDGEVYIWQRLKEAN
jgi:hypothetical protein